MDLDQAKLRLENDLKCCICMETGTRLLISKCKHLACEQCWQEWLARYLECPQCRGRLRSN